MQLLDKFYALYIILCALTFTEEFPVAGDFQVFFLRIWLTFQLDN